MNLRDQWKYNFLERCLRRWEKNDIEPNLIDVISDSCGWLPLVVNEQMTVHFQGKEYVIKRTQ